MRQAPDFQRWASASLRTPGPFETARLAACYHVTNVDPSWTAERQEEHLRDLSYATLWSVAAHEVFPGHFLHFEHLRAVSPPCRKSGFFATTSFVEGWAHYAEQMVLDEGFERGNPEVRLGQLAEALVHLARTIVGIRLHTEDLSVEQGVRFFCEEAYLEESSARQEAERATFDSGLRAVFPWQADVAEVARRRPGSRGRRVLAAALPRPAARPGLPAVLDASGVDGPRWSRARVTDRPSFACSWTRI